MTQPIWAVTSYYNPARYRSRRRNYDLFRANLGVPLVTVEMSTGADFELGAGDAETLVQVPHGSPLWQKERLLNVAISQVPQGVEHVCWVDCDMIFEDGWAEETVDRLQTVPLVQCFTHLIDLPRGVESPRDLPPAQLKVDGCGAASVICASLSQGAGYPPLALAGNRAMGFGGAWAARRALLDRHGLYDAMIMGGGDRAVGLGALGQFWALAEAHCLSAERVEHFLRWAEPFFADVRGEIGACSTRLFHLWHGDIADRRYARRHELLAETGFNPARDLAMTAGGAWRWTDEAPSALKAALADYFPARLEDGAPARQLHSVRS